MRIGKLGRPRPVPGDVLGTPSWGPVLGYLRLLDLTRGVKLVRITVMWIKVLVNAVLILLISGEQTDIVNVVLDASRVVGPLRHFWESTGFCPPDPHQDFRKFIFTNDELQNLAYIGSVPNKGIKQVRIHWLLDLVSMVLDVDRLVYNFTYLDKAISLLVGNDLKPGFELMGNPSNFFSDFDDTAQIYAWRDLIASLGKHIIG